MGRLRTPRRSQPQQLVGLDPSNKYSKRVIDGFFGTSGLTLRGKVITDSVNITKTVSAAGKVRRGAANAGFSFPCDLTGNNGITIVFQYVQYSRSGTQVLFEHSVNQNTNAGTFIVYTDATANKLAFGTSAGGNYDAGTVALPALGDVVTVAVRLRFTASVSASDDIKIWINGVSPAFTSAATTSYAGNFGNYTTYFLSRAASSLQADASASMYAVLSGFASDAELRELSLNPWQLFAPVQRSIWVPVAAGGDASVNLTGASATSGVGSLVATGTATVALTGAAVTAGVGVITASGSGAGNATLTGASVTASVGTLFAFGHGSVTLTGASSAVSIGAITALGHGSAPLTGVGATASVGSITAFGHGNVALIGAGVSTSVGTVTATGNSSGAGTATLVGVQATAGAGTLTASGSASVTLTGAATSSAAGTLTAHGSADVLMTGAQATAAFGALVARGDASVLLTGAQVNAYAGSISVVHPVSDTALMVTVDSRLWLAGSSLRTWSSTSPARDWLI